MFPNENVNVLYVNCDHSHLINRTYQNRKESHSFHSSSLIQLYCLWPIRVPHSQYDVRTGRETNKEKLHNSWSRMLSWWFLSWGTQSNCSAPNFNYCRFSVWLQLCMPHHGTLGIMHRMDKHFPQSIVYFCHSTSVFVEKSYVRLHARLFFWNFMLFLIAHKAIEKLRQSPLSLVICVYGLLWHFARIELGSQALVEHTRWLDYNSSHWNYKCGASFVFNNFDALQYKI